MAVETRSPSTITTSITLIRILIRIGLVIAVVTIAGSPINNAATLISVVAQSAATAMQSAINFVKIYNVAT